MVAGLKIHHAEEYELGNTDATAGPSSRVRNTHGGHRSTGSSSVLFDVSSSSPSDQRDAGARPYLSPRILRRQSLPPPPDSPLTPKRSYRAQFLEDEGIDIPNISGILGLDDDKDRFAVATGMSSVPKKRVYLLMEEPSSSREAFYIHISVTGIILFSALLTMLSTLPTFHTDPISAKILFALDIFLVLLFTAEFACRVYGHSDSWTQLRDWLCSFLTWIDLSAILPFYVELALKSDTSAYRWSILRVFRLLRVFRSFSHSSSLLLTMEAMFVAVKKSSNALLSMAFFLIIVILTWSVLVWTAERGEWDENLQLFVSQNGEPSQFTSIPIAAWYVLTTISTTGYGDFVPVSAVGRLLTVPLLVFGLLLLALPSFVLGRNFSIVFDAMERERHTIHRPGATRTPSNRSSADGPAMTNLLTETPTIRRPTPIPVSNPAGDDISNIKLAKNQVALMDQIEALRRTLDQQGAMLRSLVSALDASKSQTPNGYPPGDHHL